MHRIEKGHYEKLGIIHTITGEETPKNTLAKDVPF
jgi:hypothetical protein